MTRQQGLELIEVFFGDISFASIPNHQLMHFIVPTKSLVDSKGKSFNLQTLTGDPRFGLTDNNLGKRLIGKAKNLFVADSISEITKWIDEEVLNEYVVKMRPLLEVLQTKMDYLHSNCECRTLIDTLASNETIADIYRLRLSGWSHLIENYYQLFDEEITDKSIDHIKEYIPWIYWKRIISIVNFHNRLVSFPEEKTKALYILRNTNYAAYWNDRIRKKYSDLLHLIAGDYDFQGNLWDSVLNEQADATVKALTSILKKKLLKDSETTDDWKSLMVSKGVIIKSSNYPFVYYPRRSMADVRKHLRIHCKKCDISEPTVQELHETVMKKNGQPYNFKTVNNA